MQDPIVIVGATRTPMGAFMGDFASLAAHDLGGAAIKAAVQQAGMAPDKADEVLFGNCLMAGQGQAPARQAAHKAGLPRSTGAGTLPKMCGSGMECAILAHDQLVAGSRDVMVAGGMESMTGAPYLLQKGRGGYRMGHDKVYDHMMLDGLEDAYEPGRAMGTFGEDCAAKYHFTREQQDAYAIESLRRAKVANEDGSFANEIVPVMVKSRKGATEVARDEQPFTADPAKIPTLKPAFGKNGTVTAASSSSISDGASALVLMQGAAAAKRGLKPLARVVGYASFAREPEWFTLAPVGALQKVLKIAGWSVKDVDLFEINEAFAVVTMAAMKDLGIDHTKVNVNGGACALGHPIGATGARITTTLVHALAARGARRGVASLCIGGGEATALALELIG